MSTVGLYTSGAGALGQSARVDVIADNLANVATPGFRRVSLGFRGRLAEAMGGPVVDGSRPDPRPGELNRTGRNLDVALLSGGFFRVREPGTGRLFHTRAGNFSTDGSGTLMTADGRYRVQSDRGLDIRLDPSATGAITIGPRGELRQGKTEVARLAVVEFADATRLRRHGASLFEAADADPVAPSEIRMEQGMLEGSSVNPVAEMVELIEAMRSLEANLQMVRIQDRALDRAINDMGRLGN